MAKTSMWFWGKNESSAIVRHFARECPGSTPLHYAARVGSIIKVRILLDRGADPLVKDDRGRTPRDHARIYGPFSAVEDVLLEAEKLPWGAGSSAAAATAAATPQLKPQERNLQMMKDLDSYGLNI